jgi:enoyl-CoA hydratase/carnithine racemase
MSSPRLVDLHLEGSVAFLRMDDGRVNALGRPLLEALDGALTEAEPARVLVISGRETVFGAGLDLPALLPMRRDELIAFFGLFDRVFDRLLTYPRPIITVARGAVVAGGAILLCAGDERLVTPQGKAGINVAALGLSLPGSALEITRAALGDRGLFEAATTARLYEGAERIRVGFATEMVAPEHIDARARELATERTKLDPDAVARVREQVRRPAIERLARHGKADAEGIVERWFAPATQEKLQAAVARLRKG